MLDKVLVDGAEKRSEVSIVIKLGKSIRKWTT
jgi:hypothetical protein